MRETRRRTGSAARSAGRELALEDPAEREEEGVEVRLEDAAARSSSDSPPRWCRPGRSAPMARFERRAADPRLAVPGDDEPEAHRLGAGREVEHHLVRRPVARPHEGPLLHVVEGERAPRRPVDVGAVDAHPEAGPAADVGGLHLGAEAEAPADPRRRRAARQQMLLHDRAELGSVRLLRPQPARPGVVARWVLAREEPGPDVALVTIRHAPLRAFALPGTPRDGRAVRQRSAPMTRRQSGLGCALGAVEAGGRYSRLRMKTRAFVALLVALAACSSANVTAVCAPGTAIACRCGDGALGEASCLANQSGFAACACGGSSISGSTTGEGGASTGSAATGGAGGGTGCPAVLEVRSSCPSEGMRCPLEASCCNNHAVCTGGFLGAEQTRPLQQRPAASPADPEGLSCSRQGLCLLLVDKGNQPYRCADNPCPQLDTPDTECCEPLCNEDGLNCGGRNGHAINCVCATC